MFLKRARSQGAPLALIFAVVALAACSAAVQSSAALQSEQGSLQREIDTAFAASDENWPAARDRLVCSAHHVLAVLNARNVQASDKARVTDLVSQALLHKVTYREFRTRYGALHALVEPEIERRRRIASVFANAESVDLGPKNFPPCPECGKTEAQSAEDEYTAMPGLSVPFLDDLVRHSEAHVRLYAFRRLFSVGSTLSTMTAADLLREDDAEVRTVQGDTPERRARLRDFAGISRWLAVRFAEWHIPAIGPADATEEQMVGIVKAASARGCRWSSEVLELAASDQWGRPLRSTWTTGGESLSVAIWSYGANGAPGDSDDVVRYFADCRTFQPGQPPVWTAAGGGVTVLPPRNKTRCK